MAKWKPNISVPPEIDELIQTSHAAGRREAWEKMVAVVWEWRHECTHLGQYGICEHDQGTFDICTGVKSETTPDTCPLLQDGEK